MEKLKVTHDHSLTDILKVLIFTLVLLIPGFMFLPSMLYFGFNEQANAPTKEVYTNQIQANMNQLVNNGNFDNGTTNWDKASNVTISVSDNVLYANVIDTTISGNRYIRFANNTKITEGHKYFVHAYVQTDATQIAWQIINTPYAVFGLKNFNGLNDNNWHEILNYVEANNSSTTCYFNFVFDSGTYINLKYVNVVDGTQLFGYANEPDITQYKKYLPNEYYNYGSYEIYVNDINTEETVVNITKQLQYNWQQVWETPLLNWTNTSILKNGLDNFTQVFGITNTSYITNLLTYELIMVAVYIVIDIVLTLFKWLTHMIGNK